MPAVTEAGKRRNSLKCSCGRTINSTNPRVQRANVWLCPDCAYLLDHPGAKRITRERGKRKPQTETLL